MLVLSLMTLLYVFIDDQINEQVTTNVTPIEFRNKTPLKALGSEKLVQNLRQNIGKQRSIINQHKTQLSTNVSSAELLKIENLERGKLGLATLETNELLEKAALKKAKDMVNKEYFSHTSPEGFDFWHWFDLVGYKYLYAGEILAVKFNSAQSVNSAWMDSPKHKENIINERFTQTGIAVVKGIYKGEETEFVVQLFAKPMPELNKF